MKKAILLSAILGIVFGAAFIVLDKAFGASLAQQLTQNNLFVEQELIQTFNPAANGFATTIHSRIQLDLNQTATTTSYLFQTSEPTGTDASQFPNLLAVATTTSKNLSALNNNFNTTTTLSSPIFLEAGTQYILVQRTTLTSGPERYSGSDAAGPETYFSGEGWVEYPTNGNWVRTSNSAFGSAAIWDFFFDITDSGGSSLLAENEGVPQLLFPTDALTTSDFKNWVMRIQNASSSGTAIVRYSQSTSSWAFSDPVSYASSTGAQIFNVPKRTNLWTITSTSSQTWYAQPMFQNADGTNFGDTIAFTVTGPDEGVNAPPGSVVTACADPNGIVKEIGCFLFAPGESSTGFLGRAYIDFQSVFPFSIFFDITNSVYADALSTSTPATLSIDWPLPLSGSTTILRSNLMEDIAGTTLTSLLFNLVLLVAILAFAWAVYHAIRGKHES